MSIRLSHSAAGTFQNCGKAYEFHYIKKIRPKVAKGALVFGSALDQALNAILTQDGDEFAIFDEHFTHAEVLGKKVYVPTYEEMVYAAADFDADILIESDIESIKDYFTEESRPTTSDLLDLISYLRSQKRKNGLDSFTAEEKQIYNLAHWTSLRRKGHLMLKAYMKKVMPRIKWVHSVQENVSVENEVGDKVVGVVDLVAEVYGHGMVILDNKTSASNYEEDSVRTSAQLALYTSILKDKYNTKNKAGFIVLNKNINKNKTKVCETCGHDGSGARHKTCANEIDGKRCGGIWKETVDPDVFIQFIVDTVPENTQNLVLENMDAIAESVKTGNFTRNLNTCHNYWGGPCPYLGLCYKGDMHGLVDTTKEKKDE